MKYFEILSIISIILLTTKVLGILSEKARMPQVLGAIFAGILLGPSGFSIVVETDFIAKAGEIGVILLMFLAGLDTDIREFRKNSKSSIIVAILGILVPFFLGTILYYKFFNVNSNNQMEMLRAFFVGVVLTATSVSITVEVLREMGKLKGRMGTVVLGAAIIDDIIGIIILTLITSLNNPEISILPVFIDIIRFFIFIGILAFGIKFLYNFLDTTKPKRRVSSYSLVFCLIMAYSSESFFGVTDITGAYFAGVLLCNLGFKTYVEKKINILSYLIFSPIFFASIGIKTSLNEMSLGIISFAILLTIVAIFSKLFGCYLGARISKFNNLDSLAIGFGMVARGEVALIVAEKGLNSGLLSETLFPTIVFLVIITTLITPIFLKLILSEKSYKF